MGATVMEKGAQRSRAKMSRNDVRIVARKALFQIAEPLAAFIQDTGLSSKDVYTILREAIVRAVASRQLEISDRVNISGISAATGIPRSAVSRIIRSGAERYDPSTGRRQQSTNRVLAAWYAEPKFTTANGQPADLKIYGRGPSFDSLVRRFGRGIPTRAVLDELLRASAVELLPAQMIRAKASLAVPRGISAHIIKVFGDRTAELIDTMVSNMRSSESPRLIANITGSTSATMRPLLRRELSKKSAEFLADIQEDLIQATTKLRGERAETVSITVFYHERTTKKRGLGRLPRRRNLRREP